MMRCTNCQKPVTSEMYYCVYCGHGLPRGGISDEEAGVENVDTHEEILTVSQAPVGALYPWHWQGAPPIDSHPSLEAIWVHSDNSIWIAGRDYLLHYNGKGWRQVHNFNRHDLHRDGAFLVKSFYALSETDVWAVGAHGLIMHFDGRRWERIQLGRAQSELGDNFQTVFALSPTSIWVGGWRNLIHYDGRCWTRITLWRYGDLGGVTSVCALSEDNVWGVGLELGGILHFDGSSWTRRLQQYRLSAIRFSVPDDGWAVGEKGTILRYNGREWRALEKQTESGLSCVHPVSRNDVWIGGNGRILHYDGRSWKQFECSRKDIAAYLWSGANRDVAIGISDIQITPAGTVFAAEWPSGSLVRYDGKQWRDAIFWGKDSLTRVAAISVNNVWAAGIAGTILHYDGRTWAEKDPEIFGSARSGDWVGTFGGAGRYPTFTAIHANSPKDIWIVDEVIFHFDGMRWHRIKFAEDYRISSFNDIYAQRPDDVWLIGDWSLYHYDGTKLTKGIGFWGEVTQGRYSFESLSGVSPTEIYAVGNDRYKKHEAAIFCYDGYRSKWNKICAIPNAYLKSIHASSRRDVWAVGEKGTIIHYDGHRWEKVAGETEENYPGENFLQSVFALSPSDVWVVGPRGKILHYDGRRWEKLESGTSKDLNSVSGISPNKVWIVGSEGTILYRE